MLACRLGKRWHHTKQDELSELRLPSWLNTAFETVMSSEH